MNNTKNLLLLSALALFWGADAQAGDSFRCGNRLVSSGDSTYKVRAVCGDPDQHDQYVEYRTVRERVRVDCSDDRDPKRRCDSYRERSVEVLVDRYIYDFGENRFIHYLTFEQGRLIGVQSGSYGYKPPAAPGENPNKKADDKASSTKLD